MPRASSAPRDSPTRITSVLLLKGTTHGVSSVITKCLPLPASVAAFKAVSELTDSPKAPVLTGLLLEESHTLEPVIVLEQQQIQRDLEQQQTPKEIGALTRWGEPRITSDSCRVAPRRRFHPLEGDAARTL